MNNILFNVNETVKVQLTKTGQEIYRCDFVKRAGSKNATYTR